MDILDIFVKSVFSVFIVAGIITTFSKSFRADLKKNNSREEKDI